MWATMGGKTLLFLRAACCDKGSHLAVDLAQDSRLLSFNHPNTVDGAWRYPIHVLLSFI